MIDTLPLATTLVAGGFAAICLVTDLRERKIFNVVTYPALAAGFILALAFGGVPGAELALFGAAVGALPALVAFLAGALGGGDVKLLAALGALVGPMRVGEAVLIACMLTLLWAGGQILWRRARAGEAPFGAGVGAAVLMLLVRWHELPAGALLRAFA